MRTIVPTGALAPTPSTRTPEARSRDRLVRLLEQRCDQLRTAGVVCFGIRDVDSKVPPLWSATRESSAPAEAPAPHLPMAPIGPLR